MVRIKSKRNKRHRMLSHNLSRRHLLLFVLLALLWVKRGSIFPLLSDIRTGDLERYIRSYGVLSPAVFVGLMVLQAILAPLPAAPLAMAGGMMFGVVKGTLLSWIGAALGAVIDFHLGRYLGGAFVERVLGEEDRKGAKRFAKEKGFYAIFLVRLFPGISFDVVSYGAGLTGMPFSTFFWATVFGMVPGTFLYSYLGSSIFAHEGPLHALITLLLVGLLFGVPILLKRMKTRT